MNTPGVAFERALATYPASLPNYSDIHRACRALELLMGENDGGAPDALYAPGVEVPLGNSWKRLHGLIRRCQALALTAGMQHRVFVPVPGAANQTHPILDVARWDTPLGRVCRAELRMLTAEPGSYPPGGAHPAGVMGPEDQEQAYLEAAFRLSWAATVMAGGYVAEEGIGLQVTGTRRMSRGVQIVSYAARMDEDGLLIRTRKTPRSKERTLKILFPVRPPLITDAPEPGATFRAWSAAQREKHTPGGVRTTKP